MVGLNLLFYTVQGGDGSDFVTATLMVVVGWIGAGGGWDPV